MFKNVNLIYLKQKKGFENNILTFKVGISQTLCINLFFYFLMANYLQILKCRYQTSIK